MGPKKTIPTEAVGTDIIADNPEKFYTFGDFIGEGKFAQVKKCSHKTNGGEFAAKIIRFDDASLKFAMREYNFMKALDMSGTDGLVKLIEAYVVQKYLILIVELAGTGDVNETLLKHVAARKTLTEDHVCTYVKGLLETLNYMHSKLALHLDLRPTNIRVDKTNQIKIVDYNTCNIIANRKSGSVVDVLGDTEFCAPEMLNFESVMPETDMWTVGILTYIMLSGVSPFFDEDEDVVVANVQKVKFTFEIDELQGVSTEAVTFMKKCLVRAPESRLTAESALAHTWLSDDYADNRKKNRLDCQSAISETDERLCSEEEEDYIYASFKLRTFEEDENVTTELSDEEE